ncbi:MAG: pentapeptide repeat-containing protein [Chloroflexota bacterium]
MSTTNILQDKARESADARKKLGDIITLEGFTQTIVIIAVLVAIVGYINQHGWLLNATNVLGDFYANVSSELLSIIVTVLVLERLNARRQDEQEKRRLIALLGSNERAVTGIAIAELEARGWLEDGSLQGITLLHANLQNVDLKYVDLSNASMGHSNFSSSNLRAANLSLAYLGVANFRNADLYSADLRNADLFQADLSRANLFRTELNDANLSHTNLNRANLERANLSGAILSNANLSDAKLYYAELSDTIFDKDTILPDGTNWTPETDITRFTNREHPNFWQPPRFDADEF